jgi:hypothetical protein
MALTRWVISRSELLGSRNVTTSPGRASSGAIVRTTEMSPVPSAGSMLPDSTASGRASKASGATSASAMPAPNAAIV